MFKNLQAEMLRSGMSTADFAKKIGISESAAYKELTGRNAFKLPEIRTVLSIFPEHPWEYLFEDDEEKPRT